MSLEPLWQLGGSNGLERGGSRGYDPLLKDGPGAVDLGVVMADLQAVLNDGSASAKQGRPKDARKAFQKLINSGDPNWAERGRIEFGAVLKKQGDLDGATAAFEQTMRSGHPH